MRDGWGREHGEDYPGAFKTGGFQRQSGFRGISALVGGKGRAQHLSAESSARFAFEHHDPPWGELAVVWNADPGGEDALQAVRIRAAGGHVGGSDRAAGLQEREGGVDGAWRGHKQVSLAGSDQRQDPARGQGEDNSLQQ